MRWGVQEKSGARTRAREREEDIGKGGDRRRNEEKKEVSWGKDRTSKADAGASKCI